MFINSEIYLILIITFFIIFPWLETHKIKVNIEYPSNTIALIKMEGYIPPYMFGRVSNNPLFEWHAFALCSYGKDAKEHMMIVGAVGDWTKGKSSI